jgi:hypothetical protein
MMDRISLFLFRFFGNKEWYKRWQANRARKALEKKNRELYGDDYKDLDVEYTPSPELVASLRARDKAVREERQRAEAIQDYRDELWAPYYVAAKGDLSEKRLTELENEIEAKINERYPQKG